MKYIEFIVNGITLDIPQASVADTLALSFAISSLQNITEAKGSGSKTIRAPRTKKTEQAFGISYNSTVTTDINKSVNQPLIIKENSLVILNGFAKLLQVSDTEVEFSAFGTNATLKTVLGEALISELNLDDANHLYDPGVVFDTWDLTYPFGVAQDFFYPLIDYGAFYTRQADDPGTPTLASELFPAVFLRRIVSQIFIDAGFQLHTTFFDRVEMNRVMLCFSNKELLHTPAWMTDRLYRASLTSPQNISVAVELVAIDDDGTGDNFDNGGNYIPTATNYKYVVPEPCVMSVFLTFTIANIVNPNPGDQSVRITVNGVFGSPIAISSFNSNGTRTIQAINQTFAAGDEIQVVASDTAAGGSYDILSCTIYNAIQNTVLLGSTMELAYNLPQIRQIDLIRHCVQMFNWLVEVDFDTRQVYIDTWKDFYPQQYQKAENHIDITRKLDLSAERKPRVMYVDDNIPQIYAFAYADNNRLYVSDFNDNNRGRWLFGDGQYDTGNDFIPEPEEVTDLPYIATMIEKSYQFGSSYLFVPSAVLDSDTVQTVTAGPPFMLIYGGNINVDSASDDTYSEIQIDDGTVHGRSDIPLCYFVKPSFANANPAAPLADAFKVNLSFSLPEGLQRINNVLTDWNGRGLVDEFYDPQLRHYNDLRVVEIFTNLKGSDISQLTLRKPVYINFEGFTGYYIRQEIENYNGALNESTKETLIKITG